MNDLRARESYRVQLPKVVHLLGPANLFVWNSALMNAGQTAGLSESILCSIASSSPDLEKIFDARFSDVAPERRPPLKGRANPSDAKRAASQAPQVPHSVEHAPSTQPMSLAQATPATIQTPLFPAVIYMVLNAVEDDQQIEGGVRVEPSAIADDADPTWPVLPCSPDAATPFPAVGVETSL